MNLSRLLQSEGIDADAIPYAPVEQRPFGRFEQGPIDFSAQAGGVNAPSDFDKVFADAGDAYGVDPVILKSIAYAESRFNPDIISGKRVSSAGAIGLMQFMPDTAKQYGINPTNPIEAIFGAAAYMRESLDKFGGDYGKAVASYNAGPNRKDFDAEDWDLRMPAETQKYIATVFGAAKSFKGVGQGQEAAVVSPPAKASTEEPASKEWQSKMAAEFGVPIDVVTGAIAAAKKRTTEATSKNKWDSKTAENFFSSVAPGFIDDAVMKHQLENSGIGATLSGMKLTDVPKMLNRGVVNMVEGVNALMGNDYDVQLARKASDDIAKKYSDALRNEYSMTAGVVKTTAESLPGMAAGLTVGAPLSAGMRAVLTGTNAGRAALLATGLRSPTAAALLENAPGKLGAVIGEGLASATSGAAQAGQEFDNALKAGKVQSTDRFKRLTQELGTEAAAADVMRREAINQGAALQGGATAVTSLLLPNLEARMLNGAAGKTAPNVLDRILAGKPSAALGVKIAKEPLQEFVQSGAESVAGDIAAKNTFDPQRQVGDGALTDASMGALSGLVTSGAMEGRGMVREFRIDRNALAQELAALKERNQPPKVEEQPTTPQAPEVTTPPKVGQTSQKWTNGESSSIASAILEQEGAGEPRKDGGSVDALPQTQDGGQIADMGREQVMQQQQPAISSPNSPEANPLIPSADGSRLQEVILQNRNRSTPASIQQMQDIAARPDYGRLGFSRDFANGAPVVAGATASIPDAQKGRTDTAVASDGTRIPVRYAVIDAAQVLTSNTADGLPNAAYSNSQVQGIRAIAGNGRVAGLQAAYSRNTTETYKQEMMQDAALHGIAPEVIQGMQQPVLVRVMPNERVTKNIGDLSNTQSNLSLSAVEQAKNDVARVDLGALTFDEGGTVTQAAMRQFVMAMPATEQGQLMDTNGRPTRQAVDRLNAAIFARAYGNDQLVRLYAQAQDPEARLVMSALAQVAPKMARLEGLGALDVREIVTQAAEIAVNARREGKSIGVAARQLDIAAEGAVAVVLDLFASSPRSSKPVIEALSRMADIAYVEATKPESDMFGQVPKATREQIIDTLREGQANDTASPKNMEQQAGGQLDGGNAEGGSPQRGESPDAGTAQAGKQPAASPTQQQDQLLAYSRQEAKDRQQTNDEVAVLPDNAVKFSRTSSARAAYEARIDELFDGAKANLKGVRVLDKADLLGLLGYADKPVNLFEGKVIGGQKNHPHMTAEVWKKVPEWLDAPAAVFDSDTVIGRLVFVAPELVNGYMALIIVEPNAGALDAHVLVNAYDKDGGDPPIRRWVKDGLTRYVDQKKFPTVFNTSRLQLPGTAFQNKPGTRKILTEKNLSGYKKSAFDPNDADIRKSFAGQSAKTADTMALSTAQARLRDGDDAETVRQETGWFKGVDGKWRFEINDADASLKIGYKGNPIALGAEKVPNQSGWMRLSDVLDHPALFAAYPDLQDTLVKILPTSEMKGSLGFFRQSDMSITLDGGMNKVKALSVLLHEVQHGIQSIEGFASGGSVKNAGNLAENDYMRLAGEVEARNVQARQKMNGSERRAMPPIATADVPDADAIVVFNGERMDSAESLAQSKARPRTPAANIRKALEKAYGKLFSRLESQGLVTLAQTEQEAIEAAARARADKLGRDYQDELDELMDAVSASKSSDLGIKYSADGLIQGFFDPTTRRAYMVADALFEDTAGGVLMHEVGIHMAADGKLAPLLNRANLMVKNAKGEFFDTVRAKMEKAGETSAEEAAAYLVEAYENNKNNTPPSVKQWFKDFMAAVRAWLFSNGVLIRVDQLTDADIAAVARANARSFARGDMRKDTAANDLIVKSRSVTSAGGVSTSDLSSMVERLKAANPNLPKVNVLAEPSQAPQVLRDYINAQEAWDVEGAMHDGELYLFASGLSDMARAEHVLIEHEAAHYGLRAVLGDKLTTAMNLVYDQNEAVRKAATELQKRGEQLTNAQATEEVIVDIPAKKLAKLKGWRKVVEMARAWLAKHGYERTAQRLGDWLDSSLSSQERADLFVAELVQAARDYVAGVIPAGSVPVAVETRLSKAKAVATGEFGPSIRLSRATNNPQNATTWEELGDSRLDSVIYQMQDDKIDLLRVQENIEKEKGQIREEFDARLAETLFPGRVARRVEVFMDGEARSLLKHIAENNLTLEELGDYMMARHAPERNAQIAKINPAFPDGGAGKNSQGVEMTTQAAKDYIANLPSARRTMLELLAGRVDAITKGTRDLLVREGLEKAETVAAWEAAYKHYVPLFKDESAETPGHPVGSGLSVTGSSSKRAMGSDKEATNIVAHVLMQREAAITRAEKNRVAMSLYGLALSNPNKEFWTTVKPNMSAAAITAELQAMGVDPMEGIAGMEMAPTIRFVDPRTNTVVERPNPMYKRMENAIVVKVGGEDRVILFNMKNARAKRLVESLKNQNRGWGNADAALNMAGKVTNFIAAMATQYNPAFGMVNAVRDVQGALVNLSTTEIAGKQAQVMGHIPAALKGIARDLRGDTSRTQWSDLWEQFQDDGGRTGIREMLSDPYEKAARIEKDIAKMKNEGNWTPGNAAHAALDMLSDFNDSIENAVRLAAYKVALDNGVSRAKAARLARELTVDFNRKGRAGRELGKLYAFFNASVQGTARLIKSIRGPIGKRIIAGGFALGVIQALMLSAAGMDDDEELKAFIKARNFVIPIGDKKYVTIPLALGLHVLPNVGRVLTELSMGDGQDLGLKSLEAIGETLSAFNPLGGGGDWKADPLHAAGLLVMPTPLDAGVDLARNRNFTGARISKERNEFGGDVRPGHKMARESTKGMPTGQAYIAISKAFNSLTGGTDNEKGFVSPTPEELRYLSSAVGGGVYREAEKVVNSAIMLARGEEVKTGQIPLTSRFVGEVDMEMATTGKYHKNSEKLNDLMSRFRASANGGDAARAQELQNDPRFAAAAFNSKIQTQLHKLNKLIGDNIGGDKERLAELERQRLALMEQVNKAIKDAEKKR